MKCPACQFENPDRMSFCGKCGTTLDKACPQCAFSNPPDFNFCGKCGHPLAAEKQSPPPDYSKPHSYTPKFLADKILTTRGERSARTLGLIDFPTAREAMDRGQSKVRWKSRRPKDAYSRG